MPAQLSREVPSILVSELYAKGSPRPDPLVVRTFVTTSNWHLRATLTPLEDDVVALIERLPLADYEGRVLERWARVEWQPWRFGSRRPWGGPAPSQRRRAALGGWGTPRDRNNVRNRVLANAIARANAPRTAAGLAPIEGATNHTLRRTFASLLYEAGASPAYVMAAMGHTSSGLALEVYARKLERERDTGARMDALLRGAGWAQTGTSSVSEPLPVLVEDNISADKPAC